ncbi:MAG: hypothetical protein R3B39_00195 [Candidatus Paceibacterota bacterium]
MIKVIASDKEGLVKLEPFVDGEIVISLGYSFSGFEFYEPVRQETVFRNSFFLWSAYPSIIRFAGTKAKNIGATHVNALVEKIVFGDIRDTNPSKYVHDPREAGYIKTTLFFYKIVQNGNQ